MGIVIVRVFGGGPIGSSLFCLNSELRIRQRNKEDKGQNITFIMKKKRWCWRMCLMPVSKWASRCWIQSETHAGRGFPRQGCGNRSQAPVSNRICAPERKGGRAELLLPSSFLQNHPSKKAFSFLMGSARMGQREDEIIILRGQKHQEQRNRAHPPKPS